MLNAQDFYQLLKENAVEFFAGVPDSALKDFLLYLENESSAHHIIAANEGNAVALAAGYHLATGKIGLVYMQNSGFGNSINPIVSLADPGVYQIPVLLLIGWRGEPGQKDEPQHLTQGKITEDLLKVLNIPYAVLPQEPNELKNILQKALTHLKKQPGPYALLVRQKTFIPSDAAKGQPAVYPLTREEAIKVMADHISEEDIVVSTTGKTSRELFEYRASTQKAHDQDFLTIGSMGHCSQIALGIALQQPSKTVYCLDGDGAVLMHMGSLAIIGTQKPANFVHVVINNGVHDSVGGQSTVGFEIDLCAIAKACGYPVTKTAASDQEIKQALDSFSSGHGPFFLEIRVRKGARKDLGRPTLTPVEAKNLFMNHLQD